MSRVWSKFTPVLSGACLFGVVASGFCADEQPVTQEQPALRDFNPDKSIALRIRGEKRNHENMVSLEAAFAF